jgi:hypothetical protein
VQFASQRIVSRKIQVIMKINRELETIQSCEENRCWLLEKHQQIQKQLKLIINRLEVGGGGVLKAIPAPLLIHPFPLKKHMRCRRRWFKVPYRRNKITSDVWIFIFVLCYKSIGILVTVRKSQFVMECTATDKDFPSVSYGRSVVPMFPVSG